MNHYEYKDTQYVGKNSYEILASVNLADKTEKKGKFSYVSWAWAVDALMRHDPSATFTYEPVEWFMLGETNNKQGIVRVSVTAFDKTLTEMLPITDNFNKPITNPNVFDLNTAYKRCLVKCIAMFGLGLYIYAGEDLPTE